MPRKVMFIWNMQPLHFHHLPLSSAIFPYGINHSDGDE